MLRLLKCVLLVPVLLLLGFAAADKVNSAATAHQIVGVDAAAYGAVPNHDWESLNPFGCRYRFNLGPGEFDRLRRQLTPLNGWELCKPVSVSYPSLNDIATEDCYIYTNHDLPTLARWVVYNPKSQLLYLGYYSH